MPKRGVVRFGKRGKLSPRFIGPFEILERAGIVAYWLALLPIMLGVHEVFHVFMLRRYTPDPTHVVDWGEIACHTPIPGPTRMVDPNWVRGARLYTGTLIDLFFLRAELVPVDIQTIFVITKIIYIHKRITIGVVSIKIYTHILSLIYLYMYICY